MRRSAETPLPFTHRRPSCVRDQFAAILIRFYDSTSVMMEWAGLVLFALFPFTEKLNGCA